MANIIKKLNPKMRRVLHTIFKVILVLLGTFILAFGTGIFLVPFNIITGGVSGIAILVGKINILKVAHHGSKSSSMKDFISKLSPDMAIISCGINNRYGHPDSETLEVLKCTGCNVFETDLSGQISIFYNKKSWIIKTKIK